MFPSAGGKREVSRGGARVRSYVRKTPVHEQVNLREDRSAFSGFSGSSRDQERGSERSDAGGNREVEGAGYDPRIDKSGL